MTYTLDTRHILSNKTDFYDSLRKIFSYHYGGEKLLETISTLSVLLEKYSDLTWNDFRNMCKNLDGNLKDIGSGTHIKIPTDAGYVNFYKSANCFEMQVWMKLTIQDKNQILPSPMSSKLKLKE